MIWLGRISSFCISERRIFRLVTKIISGSYISGGGTQHFCWCLIKEAWTTRLNFCWRLQNELNIYLAHMLSQRGCLRILINFIGHWMKELRTVHYLILYCWAEDPELMACRTRIPLNVIIQCDALYFPDLTQRQHCNSLEVAEFKRKCEHPSDIIHLVTQCGGPSSIIR